jgi:hypothetical protein
VCKPRKTNVPRIDELIVLLIGDSEKIPKLGCGPNIGWPPRKMLRTRYKEEAATAAKTKAPDQPGCYHSFTRLLERLQKRDHLLLLFVGQVPEVVNDMRSLIPVTCNRVFQR